MENFRHLKKIEKEFNVTIAYYSIEQDKPKFVMVSDGLEIEKERLAYQKYPKIQGIYVMIKANCSDSNCNIGKPAPCCIEKGYYCRAKCAVWFYEEFATYTFRVEGERLLSLIEGELC